MKFLESTWLLALVVSAEALAKSPRLRIKPDHKQPALIHGKANGFSFQNQFLSDDDALLNAPPETGIDPQTPGTETKRSLKDAGNFPEVEWSHVDPSVVKFDVASDVGVIGAAITFPDEQIFYGAWEYPFNESLSNTDIVYDVKGLYGLDNPGTDWASGRAPFFFTRSGLGFYIDSNSMGRFRFEESSNSVTFAFNATEITYYVFAEDEPKKLLEQYGALSNTAELPSDIGYGPIFWNNDWNTHWPEGVSNAEENFYDVVDQLYYNQIRATSMFADRKISNLLIQILLVKG